MKINRTGVTRLVIEFNKIVVKVPNFTYSWNHFLKGLIASMNERDIYRWHPDRDILAPVKWCSWGGWILVMEKADIKRHMDEVRLSPPISLNYEKEIKIRYNKWIEVGLGGDDKPSNYGYIKDKLVKVDYGN